MVESHSNLVLVGIRWFHGKIGRGGPTLPTGEPFLQNDFQEKSRRELLDRYHSHTKYCSACRGALRNFRILKYLSFASCLGFAVYGLSLAYARISGAGGSLLGCFGSVVGVLLSFFASQKMEAMEQKFIFVDYEQWKT